MCVNNVGFYYCFVYDMCKKNIKSNKNCMFCLYKIDYKFQNMIFIVNVMIVVILMDDEYAAMATMTIIITG